MGKKATDYQPYQFAPNIKDLGRQVMGKIFQKARVVNTVDLVNAEVGLIPKEAVREADVNFLVDTGAAMLCLPLKTIRQLGLTEIERREVKTANGPVKCGIFRAVTTYILDRQADMNVMELPDDGTPALLGYLPLEMLDLYPNPKTQILEGNPATDGKMIIDLF